jgi:ABC-type branched-subunit amino acid transport system substrate-binding protein
VWEGAICPVRQRWLFEPAAAPDHICNTFRGARHVTVVFPGRHGYLSVSLVTNEGRDSVRTRTSRLLVVAAVGAAMALTACGSSGSSGTPSTSASASGSPATGSVVDVWTAAPIGAAGASAPQASSGVKAAFNYLNANGGLGPQHQKVVVKVCNTQLTPQGEIQCGAQAASDPLAIAMVSPIVVIATQPFMAGLQKAGLPDINPAVSDTSEATSPISFPLTADIIAPSACAVLTGQSLKVKTIGFAGSSTAVTVGEINTAMGAATKAGFTPVGPVLFPITTTDVTPFVTQLSEKNPQATVLTASPQNVGQWLAAQARLGKAVPTCTNDALTPPQVLIGLGPAAQGFYTAASLPDPAWTGYPMLDAFRQQAAAEVAAGDASASLQPTNSSVEVLSGWMGAQALIQGAANATGAITRSTLLTALNHTTATFGTDKPLIPPINWSQPAPNPKYPRVYNTTMFLKQWNVSTHQFDQVTNVQPVDVSTLIP